MTNFEVLNFFPWTPNCQPNLGANTYHVPTLAWLRGPFWEAFRARYWYTAGNRWTIRWECRDFARAYACMATECWAADRQSFSKDESLAVGEIWFRPTPFQGHAICPVFTENGLQYIEPQDNSVCELSPEQFQSRYFLRF